MNPGTLMLESGLRPTLWHSCVVDIPICGNKCLREGRASVVFAFGEFLSDICTPSTWTAVFKKKNMHNNKKSTEGVHSSSRLCFFTRWSGTIHHKNIWLYTQLKGLSVKLLIHVSYLMGIAFHLTQNGRSFLFLLLLGHHFFFILVGRSQNPWSRILVKFGSGWLAFSLTTVTLPAPNLIHSCKHELVRVVGGHAQMVLVDLQLWPEPVL